MLFLCNFIYIYTPSSPLHNWLDGFVFQIQEEEELKTKTICTRTRCLGLHVTADAEQRHDYHAPYTFASFSTSSSARCDWNLEHESNPNQFLYLLYLNSGYYLTLDRDRK